MADIEFNPEATDGDGDGILQDGTPFERPVEDQLVDPTVEETVEAPVEDVVEAVVEDVVVSPEPVEEAPAIVPVENGVIGTGKTAKKKKATVKKGDTSPVEDKVALHSTRNVSWTGVGKVYRGYNIVTESAAEKWLTRDHVRLATPEEIKQEFGK